MALLKPTIKELRPSNVIVLHTIGGSPQGFSDQLQLLADVKASAGASLPVNAVAVLTIINSAQYRFSDGSSEIAANFQQTTSTQKIELLFRIKNVYPLTSKPAPLILTVCTYDVSSGEDFKLCNSGQFPVTRSGASVKIKSFK